MPIFEYKCNNCDNVFELLVLGKSSNNNLTCKNCGGTEVHKIISPVGIIFKGSGFYVTDTRNAKKSALDTDISGNGNGNGNGTCHGNGNGNGKHENSESVSTENKSTTETKTESKVESKEKVAT